MIEYLYRILYRTHPAEWPKHLDPNDNKWNVLNNRSYSTLSTAKGVKSNDERRERTNYYWDQATGYRMSKSRYEYRIQRYPLTQEWEDVND